MSGVPPVGEVVAERPGESPGPVRDRFRIGLGEAAGAVADLGVLVPLMAALVLVNGLDVGAVLLAAGVLVVASGAFFRIPFPVQPLKALTAVAVAHGVAPEVVHAAGLEIGLVLLLLSVRPIAAAISRAFSKTVVRALQLGVGILLVVTAFRLVSEPPAVFQGAPPTPWPLALALGSFLAVVWSIRSRRHGVSLVLLALSVAGAWIAVRPEVAAPSVHLPTLGVPPPAAWGTALWLLVVPQVPLTFGNAVVAVSQLAHEYFGASASRVRPWTVCVSCGVGNVGSALLGGMPMCHGAGGLTAHFRLGARTAGMNLLLGGALAVLGAFFAPQVLALLGLLPVWVLGAFLAYAGVQHALLVQDLEGGPYLLAVGAGAIGAILGNLAITTAVVIGAEAGSRALKALPRLRAPLPRTGRR